LLHSTITDVRGRFRRLGLDRRFWFFVAIFFIISLACNFSYLEAGLSGNLKVFMIAENEATTATHYLPPLGSLGDYAWNDYYSGGSFGLDPLSFRTTFSVIGQALNLQTVGIIALEKISFQFLAFLGAFILIRYYLNKRMQDVGIVSIAAFMGALVYGFNPSFILGDSYYVGIQLSLTSLPWIIWTFSKVALDDKWIYLPFCAVIMAMNVDEHFIWAGFPILLFLYMFYCFSARKGKLKNRLLTPTVAFFVVMVLDVSLMAYRLIFRLTATSSQGVALSSTGLSAPWSHATLFNMLIASSHMDLASYYAFTSNPFSLLNYLLPAAILITAVAFFAVYRYSKYNEVLFFSFVIVLFILFFYKDSPFKWVHEYLFFNTPIGLAFRTWRVSDALVALSLSVLFGFGLISILRYVKGKRTRIFGKQRRVAAITFLIVSILVISAYTWPILFTNPTSNLGPVDIPVEFQTAGKYLDSLGDDFRAVYLPYYGSNKPVWSPTIGTDDIWTFSSSIPTILFGTNWNHYGYYALDSSYSASLFLNQDVESLAAYCGWANIGYLVIHDDTPALHSLVQPMISKMENSSAFEEVFHQGMVYIFKDLWADYRISTNQDLVLADGGYRLMNQFMKSTAYSRAFTYDFMGQDVSTEAIASAKYIISDKSDEQLTESLTYMEAMANSGLNLSTIYPYDQVLNFNPTAQWSRGSYWDPHQNEWHPYVDWLRYSFDYDMDRGVVYTIRSSDSVNLVVTPADSGNSYVIVRYFANEQGGSIQITGDGIDQTISTYSDYDGFMLAKIPVVTTQGQALNLVVKNIAGFNGISAISVISNDSYASAKAMAIDLLTTKTVYKIGIDVLSNPSFDNGTGGWQVYYRINDSKPVSLPLSIFINQDQFVDGVYSLFFAQNKVLAAVEEYQVVSEEFTIDQNKTYTLSTGSLPYGFVNATATVTYLDKNDDLIASTNISIDQRTLGTLWRSNQTALTVPVNATSARVSIDLMLKNNDTETWKCWIDNVRVLSSDKVDLTAIDPTTKNSEVQFIRVSPVEYHIQLTNVTGQAIVSFRESFSSDWVLRSDDGTVQAHFENNGIINGYVVEGNGTVNLTLYYTQQDRMQIGYWISYAGMAATLSLIIGCLAWTYLKRRK
jgi:hypothetical protein